MALVEMLSQIFRNTLGGINRRCKRGLIGETMTMVSTFLPFPKGEGKLEKILKISSNTIAGHGGMGRLKKIFEKYLRFALPSPPPLKRSQLR